MIGLTLFFLIGSSYRMSVLNLKTLSLNNKWLF